MLTCQVRLFQQLFSSMGLNEQTETRFSSTYPVEAQHASYNFYSQWPVLWFPMNHSSLFFHGSIFISWQVVSIQYQIIDVNMVTQT